jgi:hypothetical protein
MTTQFDRVRIVRLNVPMEVSHVGTPDGNLHPVELDGAGRFIKIKAEIAQQMICTGLPSSIPLRDANAALADALGPFKPEPGINLRAYEEAQRRALLPPSRNEIAAETLAMYRRAMGYDV